MSEDSYQRVAQGFAKESDVPKDHDLYYRCMDCGVMIPSVPSDNVGCDCGNIFIDKDYWRLLVVDLGRLEVFKADGEQLSGQ